jgi:hypothetical protein
LLPVLPIRIAACVGEGASQAFISIGPNIDWMTAECVGKYLLHGRSSDCLGQVNAGGYIPRGIEAVLATNRQGSRILARQHFVERWAILNRSAGDYPSERRGHCRTKLTSGNRMPKICIN